MMVAVIIVHYGKIDLLKECISSVSTQEYKDLEIVVINNSRKILKNNILMEIPGVVINNYHNRYYADSLNQGIRKAKGEYVLILNNDVILDKSFISECMKIISSNSRIGIVSGKILDYKGGTIDSAGQFLSKYRKPVERGYQKRDKGQYEFPRYVFGACGATVFLSKKMLEELKIGQDYFCKEYKMFYEDLDLNWRANKRSWKGYYTPYAVAYHKRGSSTQKKFAGKNSLSDSYFYNLPVELKFHVIKNRYMTLIRNEEINDFITHLFWIIVYDFALWIVAVISSPQIILKIKNLPAYFKIAIKQRKSKYA